MTDTTYDAEIVAPVPVGIDRALRAFLTDWLTWAEEGAPEPHRCFTRLSGLCSNALWWGGTNHTTEYDAYDAREDLLALFGEDGYPFGREAFYERSRNRTQHLDPNRLAWVRATLAANPEPTQQEDRTMYEIKKDVPPPVGKRTKYPFGQMEIGDCFDGPRARPR